MPPPDHGSVPEASRIRSKRLDQVPGSQRAGDLSRDRRRHPSGCSLARTSRVRKTAAGDRYTIPCMPTFIPDPWIKVIQKFTHSSGGDVLSVTYGIQSAATLDAAQAVQAVSEADADFRSAWKVGMAPSVTIQSAIGYWLMEGTGSDPENDVYGAALSTVPAESATGTGNYVSSNVAAIIKKKTAAVGRANRGRIYMPWSCPEADVSDIGVISTTHLSSLQTRANSWLSNALTGTEYHGLWLLHEQREPGPQRTPTEIVQLVPAQVVGTQRRRLP